MKASNRKFETQGKIIQIKKLIDKVEELCVIAIKRSNVVITADCFSILNETLTIQQAFNFIRDREIGKKGVRCVDLFLNTMKRRKSRHVHRLPFAS